MKAPTINDIPIWIINLPSSTKRAEAMDEQLCALGLTYQKFDAVDGRADWDNLKSTVDIAQFERNVGRVKWRVKSAAIIRI